MKEKHKYVVGQRVKICTNPDDERTFFEFVTILELLDLVSDYYQIEFDNGKITQAIIK